MRRTPQQPLPHQQPAPRHGVWLMLLAATAVLVGMLGMHVITIGPADHSHGASTHPASTHPAFALSSGPSTATGEDVAEAQVPAGVLIAVVDQVIPDLTAVDDGSHIDDDCDDTCMVKMCLFVGMMCVMALLTAALALRSRPGTRLLFPLVQTPAHDPPLRRLSIPPRPPSLVALSISRT